jgi:hypothetical protein
MITASCTPAPDGDAEKARGSNPLASTQTVSQLSSRTTSQGRVRGFR